MRLLLAAINCAKGDPAGNLAVHLDLLRAAREQGCDLVVFPEMSLSGSVDPATHPERLLALDAPEVAALVAGTAQTGVDAVFGIAEAGDEPHITQMMACDGEVTGVYRKRHLGEGEEAFAPGSKPALLRFGGMPVGVAICAEGSVDYPFDEPARAGAALIVFCAAPGLYGRRLDDAAMARGHEWWRSAGFADAERHAKRTGAWIALVTQAGATEDEDFPGGAALFAPTGEIVAQLPDWRPGTLVVDVP